MDLKKKGCVRILRLKKFTLLILRYNIFQLVSFWLDTVLSYFFILSKTTFVTFEPIFVISLLRTPFKSVTVWGLSLNNLSIKYPRGKNRGVQHLVTEQVFKQSNPKSQFSLKIIAQKWHALFQWSTLLVVLSGLWVKLYHGYQHLLKIYHFTGL